jgi:hypothetical protein
MVSKKLIFTLIFRKYVKNSTHLKHYLERTVKYEVDIDIISMIKSFFYYYYGNNCFSKYFFIF